MSRLQPDGERAVIYSQEIDALIRDIRRLGKEARGINPFAGEAGLLLLEARRDRSLLPRLHELLVARRIELAAAAPSGGIGERHAERIPPPQRR
jgi:hypothetical protein